MLSDEVTVVLETHLVLNECRALHISLFDLRAIIIDSKRVSDFVCSKSDTEEVRG